MVLPFMVLNPWFSTAVTFRPIGIPSYANYPSPAVRFMRTERC